MSYELFTRGKPLPEKIEVLCPECGEKNEVLWYQPFSQTYRVQGSTGSASSRSDSQKEKVEGNCKECGYKFKPDDLD
jgi:rubredoxin